jgi:hypothetical protein
VTYFTQLFVALLLLSAGCTDTDSSDYSDAPETIRDRALDYDDYEDAGCPYLNETLDHETIQQCNEWLTKQSTTSENS